MSRMLPYLLFLAGFILILIPLSAGVSNGLSITGVALLVTAVCIQFAIERHQS